MRSIWLASSALIMSAGLACAQASMSAPAPTGAPAAPAISPNPGVSPGNMSGGGTMMPEPMPPQAAQMAPAGNMSPPHPHPMMAMGDPKGGRLTMLPDASAERYLHIAADAIRHHNKPLADDALGHAETRMLTRAVPADGEIAADSSPRVTAVEHARQALASGDFENAAMETHMAMEPKHDPISGPMGGSMGAPSMEPGK